MYPNCDTLSNVPLSGYITEHDQSMVESGMTEGGKDTVHLGKHQDSQENKTNSLNPSGSDTTCIISRRHLCFEVV